MSGVEYWIWLSRTLGEGAKIDDIIGYFGSPSRLYEAGKREWILSGLLTSKQIYALSKYSPSESANIINLCRTNGWQMITPDDELYPRNLRNICNFPSVLYVWGNVEVLLNEVMISIVGTRKASNYGTRVTGLLSSALSKAGATIVSGGALGIDSMAHMGALNAGGKTIAVLGCGLGTDYLRDNAALRKEISKDGAVISEYPPFTAASRITFPMRNRIISGISLGTVVIEAGEKSGSLITARLALEQGRDVFAVPGDIISSAYTGANKLIKDGAKPVFTASDVLEEYSFMFPNKIDLSKASEPLGQALREMQTENPIINTPNIKKIVEKPSVVIQNINRELPKDISENAKKVYNSIENSSSHIDEISEKTGLKTADCLSALTELELFSLVSLCEGKKYKKV
ncbi:MAG: DNA-processing protein DprA [Oscillospiraceae bacterium]